MITKIINALHSHEENIKKLITDIENLEDNKDKILKLAIKELEMEPDEFLQTILEYESDLIEITESINNAKAKYKKK